MKLLSVIYTSFLWLVLGATGLMLLFEKMMSNEYDDDGYPER